MDSVFTSSQKGGSHVQQIEMALWSIPVAFLLHSCCISSLETNMSHLQRHGCGARVCSWTRQEMLHSCKRCKKITVIYRVKTCPYKNWKQNGACCPGIFDDLWNCTKIAGFLTGKLLRISESSLTQLFKGDSDPASLFSGQHVFHHGFLGVSINGGTPNWMVYSGNSS